MHKQIKLVFVEMVGPDLATEIRSPHEGEVLAGWLIFAALLLFTVLNSYVLFCHGWPSQKFQSSFTCR